MNSLLIKTTRVAVETSVERFYRKRRRNFSPAFFSPGTICAVGCHGKPYRITVKKVVKNGPNSYAILTGNPNRFLVTTDKDDIATASKIQEVINTNNIIKIVYRAPGVMKVDRSDELRFIAEQAATRLQEEYYGISKHPSQYRTMFVEGLIHSIAIDIRSDDQHFDGERLVTKLRELNLFRVTTSGDFWTRPVYVVGKKKLRAAIKRLLPHCLEKHRVAQAFQDELGGRDDFEWNPEVEDYTRQTDGALTIDDELGNDDFTDSVSRPSN